MEAEIRGKSCEKEPVDPRVIGPDFLMENVGKLPLHTQETTGFLGWLNPWRVTRSQIKSEVFNTILSGVFPIKGPLHVDVSQIGKKSWIDLSSLKMIPTSPAVIKLTSQMPDYILSLALGDAIGYGNTQVEVCDDPDKLAFFAKESFTHNQFNLENYLKAIKSNKFTFSDDTVETLYTELAFVLAGKELKDKISIKEYLSAVEKQLLLLLVRIDPCADAVERTNGSLRRHLGNAFFQKISTEWKKYQNGSNSESYDSYQKALEKGENVQERSDRINKFHQTFLNLVKDQTKFYNEANEVTVAKVPSCGSITRSGVIGLRMAEQFSSLHKAKDSDFRLGLIETAMMAFSLSRITHPMPGSCLGAAFHAVATYLIAFDVPPLYAQEIALEMFDREKETGKHFYEYLKEMLGNFKTFDKNWDDSFARLRCGLEMRNAQIFDSRDELLKYKAQIMTIPREDIDFAEAQIHRPFVKDKTLHNPVPTNRIVTSGGLGANWPGNSVDMPILAMQCVHLALKENEIFMEKLRRELNLSSSTSLTPGCVPPHILRLVWASLEDSERAAIDAEITQLACFTQGDKDTIGSQAKLFQALLFGLSAKNKEIALKAE